jgi:cysteinyl-tRNA synthetase
MDLTPVQEGDAVTGFQQMEAAVIAEKTFVEFFHSVKGALRGLGCAAGYSVHQEHTWNDEERVLSASIDSARAGVHAAMLDNINTPGVIKSLKELIGAVNKYLGAVDAAAIRPLLLESAGRFVTMILACLGVAETTGGIGLGDIGGGDAGDASKEEAMAPALDLIVKFRDEIRALARAGADTKALMRACDEVRDVGLPELGVKLDDREGGALWKLSNPEELRREAAREAEAKAKKEAQKRREKEEAARKAAEKEALARVPPGELFKQGEYADLYSKYDDDGLPTHDKAGEELAKAQRKKLAKTQAAQKKEHDKFLAKAAADQLGKTTI